MPSIPHTVLGVAVALAIATAACSPTEQGVVQGRTKDPVIVLSEGACPPNTCPVYDMTLHPTGAYVLNARKFVKEPGVTEGDIGKGAWDVAEDILNTSGFWTLQQVQTRKTLSNCMTEAPDAMITWRTADGKEKTVTYNAGCGVEKMQKLVRDLREVLKFDELVWTNAKFDPTTGERR